MVGLPLIRIHLDRQDNMLFTDAHIQPPTYGKPVLLQVKVEDSINIFNRFYLGYRAYTDSKGDHYNFMHSVDEGMGLVGDSKAIGEIKDTGEMVVGWLDVQESKLIPEKSSFELTPEQIAEMLHKRTAEVARICYQLGTVPKKTIKISRNFWDSYQTLIPGYYKKDIYLDWSVEIIEDQINFIYVE